jgi:hypothetical protein
MNADNAKDDWLTCFRYAPVDGDVLIALVVDVYDDDVALAGADGRAGELVVHGEDALLSAQPGDANPLYLPTENTVTS